eukprot:16446594-Heterocapsa_arctica.AAC.1
MSLGMRIAALTSSQRHAGQIPCMDEAFMGEPVVLSQRRPLSIPTAQRFFREISRCGELLLGFGYGRKSPQSFPASSGKSTNGL